MHETDLSACITHQRWRTSLSEDIGPSGGLANRINDLLGSNLQCNPHLRPMLSKSFWVSACGVAKSVLHALTPSIRKVQPLLPRVFGLG